MMTPSHSYFTGHHNHACLGDGRKGRQFHDHGEANTALKVLHLNDNKVGDHGIYHLTKVNNSRTNISFGLRNTRCQRKSGTKQCWLEALTQTCDGHGAVQPGGDCICDLNWEGEVCSGRPDGFIPNIFPILFWGILGISVSGCLVAGVREMYEKRNQARTDAPIPVPRLAGAPAPEPVQMQDERNAQNRRSTSTVTAHTAQVLPPRAAAAATVGPPTQRSPTTRAEDAAGNLGGDLDEAPPSYKDFVAPSGGSPAAVIERLLSRSSVV